MHILRNSKQANLGKTPRCSLIVSASINRDQFAAIGDDFDLKEAAERAIHQNFLFITQIKPFLNIATLLNQVEHCHQYRRDRATQDTPFVKLHGAPVLTQHPPPTVAVRQDRRCCDPTALRAHKSFSSAPWPLPTCMGDWRPEKAPNNTQPATHGVPLKCLHDKHDKSTHTPLSIRD